MLTFAENKWNFKFLEFCSTLNLLPIEIDRKSAKIKVQSKKWKLTLWKIQYLSSICHWAFTLGRLLQSLHNIETVNSDHVVANFIYTLAMGFVWAFSFCVFWSQPSELAIIFNEFYARSGKVTPQEPDNEENQGQFAKI